MKLSTVIGQAALDSLNQRGYLANDDPDRIDHPIFKSAYEWMMSQMTLRLGEPPAGVALPMWAWYQWDLGRKKPPMSRGRAPRGEVVYRIEFEVPSDQVLLSDHRDWHVVLNGGYMAVSEEEYDEYEVALHSTRDAGRLNELRQRQIKSWERIFVMERFEYGVRLIVKNIQACVWKIDSASVTRIRKYVSKGM